MSTPGKQLVRATVNGAAAQLVAGVPLIKALAIAGHAVPYVCWHPDIHSSGGRCRACVCKVDGRIQTACTQTPHEGIDVVTDDPDCVALRDAAIALNGKDAGVAVSDANRDDVMPDLAANARYIERVPELCVHCQLCVSMCCEMQGVGAVSDVREHARHGHGVVKPFRGCPLTSTECISCGQCINVCPTGALREVSEREAVMKDLRDPEKVTVVQFAPAVRIALAEEFGCKPGERSLTNEMVAAVRRLGGKSFVFDTNFTADLTIIEEGYELLERLRRNLTQEKKYGADDMEIALPMVTSCSPGWVLFCEKNYHDLLPNLSSCKSPMQMSGAITKHYWCKELGIPPEKVSSVAVMPCVAKKAEKDRPEFSTNGVQDVDHVLTTRDFADLLKEHNIDPTQIEPEEFDNPYGISTGAGLIFGATGGVMEAAIRTAYEVVTGRSVPFKHLNVAPVRGMDGVKEASLPLEHVLDEWSFLEGVELKVAVAHGTGNARKLMDRVREAKERGLPAPYHFIEVMGCPGGCLGGGGQPKPTSFEVKMQRARLIYAEDEALPIRKSHENPAVQQLYERFLKEPLGHESHRLLHTRYVARDPDSSALLTLPEAAIYRAFLRDYPRVRSGITNLLSDFVDEFGGLTDAAVAVIADHVKTTPGLLDAIVSHYHFFPRVTQDSAVPTEHQPNHAHPPDTTIYVCECVNCRRNGATEVASRLAKTLKGNHSVRLQRAAWLGWCANDAPAALVKHRGDPQVHWMLGLTADDGRIASAEKLAQYKNPAAVDTSATKFNVLSVSRLAPEAPTLFANFQPTPEELAAVAADPAGIKCPVSRKLFAMDPDALIQELKTAGLRGCGGAGFPTHFKWRAVRDAKAADGAPKYLVINADEGLPNTYKDLHLLQDPACRMRMLVGACLAAQTVGASKGYVYLRYEYKNLKPAIEAAFQRYATVINPAVAQRGFELEVVLGAGPYICGEETALFESIEGQLPQARTARHVYPTHHGLFGAPTLVGNVETFSWATQIAYRGGRALADAGTNKMQGVKLFSVTGDVARPTLLELPLGTTLRQLLEEVCGYDVSEVAAVEVGGITESLVRPPDFDKPLSLDGRRTSLAAGGSVVVFHKARFDEEEIYNAKARFAEAESCQLCTPCRDGTRILRHAMPAILKGLLPPSQMALMRQYVHAMEVSSNCGHGKAFGKMAREVIEDVEAKHHDDAQDNTNTAASTTDGEGKPRPRVALWLPRPKNFTT
eukprot:CAMPEP_0174867010 /NCGR_PEP_ID=MMETSP1114-20130205/63179_1 /TAXON_ID=312471 /ORGANISM="Neobodo designis, Strain CCAP 1951/1" /LENGTH=1234 /DNA_ID=CAMNT_0016102187 /DNA_START=152 /DNA_END=3852 /DNA_ORIENTATION=+